MPTFLVLLLFAASLGAAPDPVYRTAKLESFEGDRGPAAGWTLKSRGTGVRSHGYAVTANLEPTPAGGPNYLSVLFRGPPGSGVRIEPPKALHAKPVVREFRFFVYGFDRGDELFLDVRAQGRAVRLACGRLDFRGWRQLTIRLPPGLMGRGFRLNDGEDGVFLTGFFLRLRQDSGPLTEGRLYIDEIEAIVRPPFRAPKPRFDR